MASAALRKSITDLTRRRARTLFAIATLALAVASVSFFSIPTLIDRAMQREVRADRLADVTVSMRPLQLSDADLGRLRSVPNVAAVEPRNSVDIRVLVGARRAPARVIGVPDFRRQSADVVRVDSGRAPRAGEVLADVQNANTDLSGATTGDRLTVVGSAGAVRGHVRVAGIARNITGGEQVQDEAVIVLYAPARVVEEMSGERGYQWLAFRLRDNRPAPAAATVAAIRDRLRTVSGFSGFTNLPSVRAPGDWPGKEDTAEFADLLSVITLLALLSALVLVSNTMTTLVAEQTADIGIMRAIGARRRQVAGVYLRTAVLLGAAGALVGSLLGIAISSLASAYFGREFWAVDVGVGAGAGPLLAGIAAGLLGPPLAALPAIRRGTGTELREALEARGSVVGGEGSVDRGLRRARFLPRTMQIGLRGVGRRKRRSLATVLIVALAVGNLLAILGLATAVTDVTRAEWDDHLEDVRIWTTARGGFDARADEAIRTTPGVARAQPALVNDVRVRGEDAFVWAVPQDPLVRYRMTSGRWFTSGEERARERVAVIERNLAQATGIRVGEAVSVSTAAGEAVFRIVGIAKNQQEDGTVLFVPLATFRALTGAPAGASTYWIETTSHEPAFVDRTTSRIEDRLAALGHEAANEITYVGARENEAANSSVTTSIAVLGFIIVAMSMVGLANAVTTSILERTREIGVLRCIGARARDIRRIFTTEGLTLATAGWVAGIPLGYALDRALVWLVKEIVNIDVPLAFPLANIPLALAGTVLLALAITLLPVRRAVRLRPGDALRYG